MWDRDYAVSYPPLRGEQRADVCVVGLGGSGLACIDELLTAGVSVIGLDAGSVGGAAAGRNGGLLRAGCAAYHHDAIARYGRDRAVAMYQATVDERERLIRRLPDIARRSGYLRLAADASEENDCRSQLAALIEDRFPADWYDGPLGCGLLIRDNAVIDPRARCRAEAEMMSAAGARLFEQSRVTGLTNGLAETDGGVVHCDVVVVAVDGGLTRLLPELADRVRPTRLQMLASGPHATGLLPYAISARWGWDYGQQLPDGVIAFGGCRDVDSGSRTSPEGPITDEVQSALERRFRELAGVDPIVTHRWASTVGYTETGLPILEEVRPGVWATGAYSGTGNLLGAVCGRIAAKLALGNNTDPALFQ